MTYVKLIKFYHSRNHRFEWPWVIIWGLRISEQRNTIGDDCEHIVEYEIMEKVADSNPEEANSKRSPKMKKRCIVMLCFSLFWSLQLSADYELMEMNFIKKKRFLSTIDSFTKTSLIFKTCIIVWNIRIDLCGLFFRV